MPVSPAAAVWPEHHRRRREHGRGSSREHAAIAPMYLGVRSYSPRAWRGYIKTTS
ncbi:MAG: hypothetical protein ACLUEQ_00605 [Cloacibacillus evryensis]